MTDTKPTLDFTFDNVENCEVAFHNGYRIRAVQDDSPINPFEDHDGHLPMLYQYGGDRSDNLRGDYECPRDLPGMAISRPFDGLGDELVVHLQHNFAKVLGSTVYALLECYGTDEPVKHATVDYADVLRDVFRSSLGDNYASERLDKLAELHELLGATVLRHESRGYCQGDWASLLLVAKPEQIAHLGISDAAAALEAQAELYDAWAWGDCYGYVIEAPAAVDEDGDVTEWEEIEHGSDHDKSGLAEAALECVPDEAPVMPTYEGELEDA